MSQKKVDNYRAGKYGRSKAARKERIIDKLEILAWIAICVAMVGWIGFSAYTKIEAKEAAIRYESRLDAYQFIQGKFENYKAGKDFHEVPDLGTKTF